MGQIPLKVHLKNNLCAAMAAGGTFLIYQSGIFASYADVTSSHEQLLLGIRMLFWPSILLLFMLMSAFRQPDSMKSDLDPIGGHESDAWKRKNRAYVNSIEQMVVFFPAFLYFTVMAPPWMLPLAASLMTWYLLSRFAFWLGYQVGTGGPRGWGYANSIAIVLFTFLLIAYINVNQYLSDIYGA